MNVDPNSLTQRILELTLEMIYLLTGKDHVVVKIPGGRVGDSSKCQMSGRYHKIQGSTVKHEPLSMIHEGHKEQKILELTHRILSLLTGEVPIRFEDVTVHLSMEEWEYVERHKELYKDVMMEDHQPVVTTDKSKSGEFHSPVSFPDFGTKNGSENVTDKSGRHLKTVRATKEQVQSVTCTEQEPLAFEERHVPERDIHPPTEPIEYPSPDIKEEPEMRKVFTSESILVVGEASCKEDGIDCRRNFTQGSDHLTLQKVHPEQQPLPYSGYDEHFTDCAAPKMHQRSHTEKKLFKCSECGKCFTQSSNLARHKLIHTGEKPFKCSECGKCLTRASDLAAHKRIHTGEKPFKCTECGKCFTQASHLARHKMIHTGEKPYKCTECGNCFTWPTQLQSHKWVHSGIKPFSCSECGKCFSLKAPLHKHLKTHTGEKTFQIF